MKPTATANALPRLLPSNRLLNNAIVATLATLPYSGITYADMPYTEEVRQLPMAEAKAETEQRYTVDKSSTFKYTQPLLATAKTITVIPQAVIKDRGVETLRDALRNVSGISFAAGEGGQPTGDSMTIRGFSASTDMFVDGMRDIAGYTRDMYNTEAVEVAKGPNSAVTGRGSTGGSINSVTKTATLENRHDIAARLGSESDYRATMDSNFKVSGSSALRVNAMLNDGDTAGRDEVNNSAYGVALSYAAGLGTGARFVLNGDVTSQDNIPDYGLPWVANYSNAEDRRIAPELAAYEGGAPSVPFRHFYGNVNRDFENIDARSVTAKYEYDVGASTLLRVQARLGSVTRESIVTAPRFTYQEFTETINGEEVVVREYGGGARVTLADEKPRDTENALKALQFDVIGDYHTGNVAHNVVTGIEVSQERFERWGFDDFGTDNLDTGPVTNDLYNPNPKLAYTGEYRRDGTYQDAQGDNFAVYVFDTVTFSEQWQVSLGLRADQFDTQYKPDAMTMIETSDSMVSWSAAAVYKPAVNGSIYWGAGNSFNPSAEGLTVSTRSNLADLDPEENTSYELGTKWALLDNNVNINAAIFRTIKTNARTDAEGDGSIDVLEGEQMVTGLELGASGQLTAKWLVMASYTYQEGEVTRAQFDDASTTGEALARAPKNSFSLWNTYHVNDKLTAGLGLQFVGERYNSSDPGSRETAHSYSTVDAMAAYQFTQQFSMQLNGTNLTDEQYIDQIGGGHFIPGIGRHLRLAAQCQF